MAPIWRRTRLFSTCFPCSTGHWACPLPTSTVVVIMASSFTNRVRFPVSTLDYFPLPVGLIEPRSFHGRESGSIDQIINPGKGIFVHDTHNVQPLVVHLDTDGAIALWHFDERGRPLGSGMLDETRC